jgi:ubiquinone/menaquinone biosynthesis C-methylase UbiE
MEDEASHAARVGSLFDTKACQWSAKYEHNGSLEDRLKRFECTLMDKVPHRGRILDFGCGSGNLAAHLAALGYSVTGVDISSAMLESARKCFADAAQWIQLSTSWRSLPFKGETFDGVVASSTLEYAANLELVFREIARVTKRGGLLAATIPDVDRAIRRFEDLIRRSLRHLRWTMKAMPRRVQSYADYLELSKNRFTIEAWITIAGLAGFRMAQTPSKGSQPLLMLTFVRS